MTFIHCPTCHEVPCKCPKHMEPNYHGYTGGYAAITCCNSCNSIALYEDALTSKPCIFCGGKVVRHGSGWWSSVKCQWMFQGVPDHNKQEYHALESKSVMTKAETFMLGFLTGAALALGFYFGWAFANA